MSGFGRKVARTPMPAGIAVIDVAVHGDVEAELKLLGKPGAMSTLEYIADQGGEVRWSWEGGEDPRTGLWQPVSQQTRELVTDLINAELLREREHVTDARQREGTGMLTLWLTDKGRNVVSKHRAMKMSIGTPRPMTVEEYMDTIAKVRD